MHKTDIERCNVTRKQYVTNRKLALFIILIQIESMCLKTPTEILTWIYEESVKGKIQAVETMCLRESVIWTVQAIANKCFKMITEILTTIVMESVKCTVQATESMCLKMPTELLTWCGKRYMNGSSKYLDINTSKHVLISAFLERNRHESFAAEKYRTLYVFVLYVWRKMGERNQEQRVTINFYVKFNKI